MNINRLHSFFFLTLFFSYGITIHASESPKNAYAPLPLFVGMRLPEEASHILVPIQRGSACIRNSAKKISYQDESMTQKSPLITREQYKKIELLKQSIMQQIDICKRYSEALKDSDKKEDFWAHKIINKKEMRSLYVKIAAFTRALEIMSEFQDPSLNSAENTTPRSPAVRAFAASW